MKFVVLFVTLLSLNLFAAVSDSKVDWALHTGYSDPANSTSLKYAEFSCHDMNLRKELLTIEINHSDFKASDISVETEFSTKLVKIDNQVKRKHICHLILDSKNPKFVVKHFVSKPMSVSRAKAVLYDEYDVADKSQMIISSYYLAESAQKAWVHAILIERK